MSWIVGALQRLVKTVFIRTVDLSLFVFKVPPQTKFTDVTDQFLVIVETYLFGL